MAGLGPGVLQPKLWCGEVRSVTACLTTRKRVKALKELLGARREDCAGQVLVQVLTQTSTLEICINFSFQRRTNSRPFGYSCLRPHKTNSKIRINVKTSERPVSNRKKTVRYGRSKRCQFDIFSIQNSSNRCRSDIFSTNHFSLGMTTSRWSKVKIKLVF